MKTKKIIIIILVVCLLGGLLTFNGSAAGWLQTAASAVSTWLSSFADSVNLVMAGVLDFVTKGDSALLTSTVAPLPVSNALRFTTVNCQFVTMDILHEYMNRLISWGCHCQLEYKVDGMGNGAWFLRLMNAKVEDVFEDLTGIFAAPAYVKVHGYWLCALNDGSVALPGGGRSGRTDNNSNDGSDSSQAYVDIRNYTSNTDIQNTTNEVTIYNEYDNSEENNYYYDLEQNLVYEIDNGTSYNIESLVYDGTQKTYTFEYNKNDNRQYMNVEYHIQYTILNYVSLEDTYVLYYELPDGRNSYDMTVDELAQYSDSFDVINYAASADNDDLIALFPFNGNQENIAYNGSNLSWYTGNSITYQEVDGFGAALYLGNGNHTFWGGNYTQDTSGAYDEIYCVSFRYYYSPRQNETSVFYPFSVGVQDWGITYNGYNNNFSVGKYNGTSGAPMSGNSTNISVNTPMPVGQWVNITIQYRFEWDYNACDIYFFLNGIRVGNYQWTGLSSADVNVRFNIRNGSNGYSYIDELAVIKDTYFSSSLTANFSPPLQPYDTNLILTLPSLQAVTVDSYTENGKTYYYVYSPDQLWKPTIAVATDIPITQYYLGGVRPSLPKRGYVWVPIQSGVIGTVQYYDGSGWQETASRVWTGSQWVDSGNYSIFTNGTYNDIADTPPPALITDEQGFWAWCVSSFDTLIEAIKGSGGGGGGTVADPDVIPDIVVPGVDGEGNETEDRFSLFEIASDVLGGVVKMIGNVIRLGGEVGSFFNDFSDSVGDTFDVLDPNNQNGLFWVEVDE